MASHVFAKHFDGSIVIDQLEKVRSTMCEPEDPGGCVG
jgi:hypothetical protein